MRTNKFNQNKLKCGIPTLFGLFLSTNTYAFDPGSNLEEVIVTAQKREQNLQDTPIAISALTQSQLSTLGITSLDGLSESTISSLFVRPNGNTSSSLTISIRGDGPSDVVQPIRQSAVAVYLDGIYLGRSQGLSMELADLKRIEVLRGPQGTLFGRNSTSGAISLISNAPTGQWGLKQTLGSGNYGLKNSVTRINTEEIAGLRFKFDYVYSENDGWVKNKADSQSDFNESQKNAGKISIDWELSENLQIDYRFDQSETQSTQSYFQVFDGNTGFGSEKSRETESRFPLALKPADVDIQGHALTTSWAISDDISFKSLTSYREIDEDGFNNYGGALQQSGIVLAEDIRQEQYSQEFQLIGSHDNFNWVTGLFYFKESADYDLNIRFSLTPTFQPLIPPVAFDFAPPTFVTSEADSIALYTQGTFDFNSYLSLTAGGRYTEDNKSAARNTIPSKDIDSDHFDGSLALTFRFLENVSTYVKYATAYKAGGYNVRSATFAPYDEETNETFEIGAKSEWFDHRLRVNAAAFNSQFNDKQYDFADPEKPLLIVETLNALKEVEISGVELDLIIAPTDSIRAGLSYTYLDGDMPDQPHPLYVGESETFELIQTPQHSASVTLDHILPIPQIGSLTTHIDINSTSQFAHSTAPAPTQDSYTLVNARLTLSQQPREGQPGIFSVALWGKNITDQEYANLRFPIASSGATIQSFGTPRTLGVEVNYQY